MSASGATFDTGAGRFTDSKPRSGEEKPEGRIQEKTKSASYYWFAPFVLMFGGAAACVYAFVASSQIVVLWGIGAFTLGVVILVLLLKGVFNSVKEIVKDIQ